MAKVLTMQGLSHVIQQSLLQASRLSPIIPKEAIASHIRIRSINATQFQSFTTFTQDSETFIQVKTVLHKGRNITFCRLASHLHFTMGEYRFKWLEFTSPKAQHRNGPDALVFQIPDIPEPQEQELTKAPLFFLRFQAKSAENIVR